MGFGFMIDKEEPVEDMVERRKIQFCPGVMLWDAVIILYIQQFDILLK